MRFAKAMPAMIQVRVSRAEKPRLILFFFFFFFFFFFLVRAATTEAAQRATRPDIESSPFLSVSWFETDKSDGKTERDGH